MLVTHCASERSWWICILCCLPALFPASASASPAVVFNGSTPGIYAAGSSPADSILFSHCSFSFLQNPFQQTLVYLGTGATGITFQHCSFKGARALYANNTNFDQGKVTLVGNSFIGSGASYQLFVVSNFFFHSVNNLYQDWYGVAFSLGQSASLLSASDIYATSTGKTTILDANYMDLASKAGKPASFESVGSQFLNRTISPDNTGDIADPSYRYGKVNPLTPSGKLLTYLRTNPGPKWR